MGPAIKWVQWLALSFTLILTSMELHAKPGVGGEFGLGIIVGDPDAGISMKYWNSQTTAIDGAISWSSNRWVSLHGDYLIHMPRLIQVQRGTNAGLLWHRGICSILFSYACRSARACRHRLSSAKSSPRILF